MSTYAMTNAKFTGNIFNNMHSYDIDVSNTSNSLFDNNLFKDFINPSVIYTYWGLSYNSI
jgi:hypothetical protein